MTKTPGFAGGCFFCRAILDGKAGLKFDIMEKT